MRNGGVISDLHLLARRSDFEAYGPEIEEAAERADLFVLNGDIVDLRWTSLPTVDAAALEAAKWTRLFIGRHPRCEFHYVCGNHDHVRPLIARLEDLARSTPNLYFHREHVRFDDKLFLHGDAVSAGASSARVRRFRSTFYNEQRRGRLGNRLYDLVTGLQLHKIVYLTNPKVRSCRRMLAYLEDTIPNVRKTVRHVYFGHTHVPFSDFEFKGFTFHNTGSAIRDLKFNMLEFELEE